MSSNVTNNALVMTHRAMRKTDCLRELGMKTARSFLKMSAERCDEH